METVVRALIVYVFVLLVFRISGKRSLGQVTPFDFVLLLIIAETTQHALIGSDYSMTNAMILVATLAGIDIALSVLKQRSRRFAQLIEGAPLVIVRDGTPLREYMDREQVDDEDVLHAARETQGLERMDQIKLAVLERNGGISIVPRRESD